MNKEIVVTGGAGFIGSGVIRHLNDLGIYNIIIVDDLEKNEKWKNLLGKRFRDIINVKDFFSWLQGRESEIKAFIHLGACTNTLELDSDYLLSNNYRFSRKLAENAIKNNIRFIYASSAATYGDGALGFSDAHEGLHELRPLNPYGFSKHIFDLWLKNEGLLNQVVGLKYFNVFGPNELHKNNMASAIIKMLSSIVNEGKVRLFRSTAPTEFADGEQKRDFIYVKDAVLMTCSFLFNDYTGIFNVGSGKASTWNELAQAVFQAVNKKPKIEYIDMPKELVNKYQNYTCADMNKTRMHLKEKALTTSLDTSVIDYVRNYLIPQNHW